MLCYLSLLTYSTYTHTQSPAQLLSPCWLRLKSAWRWRNNDHKNVITRSMLRDWKREGFPLRAKWFFIGHTKDMKDRVNEAMYVMSVYVTEWPERLGDVEGRCCFVSVWNILFLCVYATEIAQLKILIGRKSAGASMQSTVTTPQLGETIWWAMSLLHTHTHTHRHVQLCEMLSIMFCFSPHNGSLFPLLLILWPC